MLERNILTDIDCRKNRASRRQIQGNHSKRADSIRSAQREPDADRRCLL